MPQARDEAGNVWEVDAQGNAVRLLQPAGGGRIIPQQTDPAAQYEAPKAQAQTTSAQAQAQVDTATIDAQIRKANAEAAAAQAQANAAIAQQNAGGGQTKGQNKVDEVYASEFVDWTAMGGYAGLDNNLRLLEDGIRVLESSDTISGGFFGRLPKFIQQAVNPASQDVKADVEKVIQQSLKAILGAQFAQKEAEQLFQRSYDPTQPEASNLRRVQATIDELRARGMAKESASQYFRANGTLTGWEPPKGLPGLNAPVTNTPIELPNAMNYTRTDGGRTGELGVAGADATERAIPYPDAMVAEHDALVQRLLKNNNNRLPPDVYAREKAKLAARFQRATDLASDEAWAGQINEYIEGGGATIPTGLQPEREAMGAVDQARNAASQSFLGAGLIGAADALSYGSLQNVEPGKMSALANEGGWTQAGLTLGQVGGTVANTMGVGSIAGRAAARFAPQMLQGGKMGQFGRNLLGDTAYGAGYGEVTQGDALGGATQAAIGSTAGQGVGSIIGRGVSGVTSSPTVNRLRGQGIQPTFGQIMRGRAADNDTWSLAAGVEDVFANNGVTGSVVNSARARTLEQANNAALNIGARGKGYVKGFGEEGIGNLADLSDSAYDDALGGVTIPPVDPADLAGARMQGAGIDAARNRGDYGFIYDNQLAPVISGPQMSGEQIQDALRLLRGQSRSYSQAARGIAPDPAAQGVADALDMTQDAITGHVGKYAPDTIPALEEANSIYRNFKVLDDAAGRAMNDGGVWTGAQLGQAMKANNAKFGQRGLNAQTNSPFYQLQQDMQNVLPNQIPPTGVNAAPALAIGGAALGATGEATDNDYLRMGALAALPAAAYTKQGQKAISAILLDRPDALRQFGESVRRRKGLFGSAAVPLALPLN